MRLISVRRSHSRRWRSPKAIGSLDRETGPLGVTPKSIIKVRVAERLEKKAS